MAQVLNVLGGPRERMDWADGAGQWDKVNRRYRYFGTTSRPSSSLHKRRPCEVKISMYGVDDPDVVQIGSPENYHATDSD